PVSAATSQSTPSPPPQCPPGQEPTPTSPRSPRPEPKSERKVKSERKSKSERKVKPESKAKPEHKVESEPKVKSKSAPKHQPVRAHKPDPKPQPAAPLRSSPPHISPSLNHNGLFGHSPTRTNAQSCPAALGSWAPRNPPTPSPGVAQPKPAPQPRQRPRRRRFDPPSHISDIFAPSKPSSSAPTDAVGEGSTTPPTTPPRRGPSTQSHPQAQESASPRPPSPAKELTDRVRPASPGSTPLPEAKRQRTLDSLLSLTGLITPGLNGAQSNLPSAPSLKLEDLARPAQPSPAPEHPGSPMVLDSPRPDVPSAGLTTPGSHGVQSHLPRTPSPVLPDSPRPDTPNQPRPMPTPASGYMHRPRVSIAEMIRLRIDFDDLSLSILPPQDEDMRGPGMGDMDTDEAEQPRVFIEQDVEMAPRVVIEEDVVMSMAGEGEVMGMVEEDEVMVC
ncbi:hypothetical protein FRC08_017091, partial [Ceratobasidium sp. 394]